jgi:hypothetical protein
MEEENHSIICTIQPLVKSFFYVANWDFVVIRKKHLSKIKTTKTVIKANKLWCFVGIIIDNLINNHFSSKLEICQFLRQEPIISSSRVILLLAGRNYVGDFYITGVVLHTREMRTAYL